MELILPVKPVKNAVKFDKNDSFDYLDQYSIPGLPHWVIIYRPRQGLVVKSSN